MQNHIGFVQCAQAFERQQTGIAGARTDQNDTAQWRRLVFPQGVLKRGLSQRRLFTPQQAENATIEHALVETPTCAEFRMTHAYVRSKAFGKRGEGAECRVEQGFEPLAQLPRQHRCRTAGRNRDDQWRTINDRRYLERGKLSVVDDVGKDPACRCRCCDGSIQCAIGGRRDDQPGLIQPRILEFPGAVADARFGNPPRKLGIQRRRPDRDVCARTKQALDLACSHGATADDEDDALPEVGEQWIQLHAATTWERGSVKLGAGRRSRK